MIRTRRANTPWAHIGARRAVVTTHANRTPRRGKAGIAAASTGPVGAFAARAMAAASLPWALHAAVYCGIRGIALTYSNKGRNGNALTVTAACRPGAHHLVDAGSNNAHVAYVAKPSCVPYLTAARPITSSVITTRAVRRALAKILAPNAPIL